MWPDRRLIELFKIELPIVQAPMAGAMDWELAAAAAEAGALGSLPCAMRNAAQIREQTGKIRAHTAKPINLAFFCHTPPALNNEREARWRETLAPYYRELAIDPAAPIPSSNRAAFDAAFCEVVEELKPEVVSFHFGLPEEALVTRVKAAGCMIISSATTAAEARWLEARGVDAVIAQGYEAGGHRGIFLSDDIASQAGTFALVPQVVDVVKVPVIAAGAITDARGIAAAFALGAAGVRHRQPPDARGRPDIRRGAGISARRRRARAVARQGRGAGLGRLLAHVGRAGGVARPRHARRPIDQGARDRGARADARTRGIEGVKGLRARDAQARPPRVGGRDARGRDREFLPGLRQPRLRRLESGGIGGLEREPGQSRAPLLAPAGAGAVPDIAGDVVVIASR